MVTRILFCGMLFQAFHACADHYVSHKDEQLDVYLNMLAANLDEKTEIVEHIKKNPKGTYIDIGTGGDGIAAIIKKIDTSADTILVAGDIDPLILENIPKRHPEVIKCLIAASSKSSGTKLILQELDATNLAAFENNSINGINGSALVHEIISYAGGQEGVVKFIREAMRVLTPQGVLVYRDPESVYNRNEMVTANLLVLPLKHFANIFLPKFLDRTYTTVSSKSEIYSKKNVFFEIYKKGDEKITLVDYESYTKIPTNQIDFQKQYHVVLPRGLCQELERHYLMFLHEYASLLFVKPHFDVDRKVYKLNFRALRARDDFLEYCKELGIPVVNGEITVNDYNALQVYQMGSVQHLIDGLKFTCTNQESLQNMRDIFQKCGLEFANYHTVGHKFYTLDYKIIALLWQRIRELFNLDAQCQITSEGRSFLDWLQREGEETYFYASPDEFIAFVGRESMTLAADGESYMLAPLSVSHNKSILRQGYSSFLGESLIVTNESGLPLPHEERKRIIHFAKMKRADAIQCYRDLITHDPEHNGALISFVNTLKSTDAHG